MHFIYKAPYLHYQILMTLKWDFGIIIFILIIEDTVPKEVKNTARVLLMKCGFESKQSGTEPIFVHSNSVLKIK